MAKTHSPVVKKKIRVGGSFGGIIVNLLAGERVARQSWDDGIYLFFVREILHIKNDKGLHRLIIARADLESIDWVVVK